MAVRNDFTAGEVLAAADLNDTFASKLPYSYGTATPSTTDSGFLWYDSNSTPAAPKFWDGAAFQNVAPAGGLTLIADESFSAVSSVSVNNCFTSTYAAYRILITANAAITGRLRASGTDATGSHYVNQFLAASSTSVSAGRTTTTSWDLGAGAGFRLGVLDIYGPALAEVTYANYYLSANVSTLELALLANAHNVTTAYDGFTLLGSTITGNLRIYGYED